MTPSLRKHPRPSQWLAFVDDEGTGRPELAERVERPASAAQDAQLPVVQVLTGKVEIGQALHAALAGWVAAALDWPVARVTVVAPDTAISPDEGVTSGSLSMQDSGRTLGGVAAIVKARLMADAALRWGVPLGSVGWEQGVLIGPPSAPGSPARREPVTVDMGQRVLEDSITDAQWSSTPSPSTPTWASAAAAARQATLVPLLRGGIHYIHDLVLPGLIHGCVLHRPGQGGEGADLDATARRLDPVRGMPGVVGVVADGGLLGVLADGAGRAERAARRLESLLEVRAGVPAPDQGHVHHADVAHATPQIGKHGAGADPTDPESWAQGDWPARIVASLPALPDGGEASAQGSAPLQAPEGGRLVQAVFTRGWLAHASIGPSCAIARWTDDLSALDVWTHSQGIHNLRRDLALAWGLDEASVRVRHVPGAGCYGHNGADDVAFDACWLARHAAGRPARVTWLREQEWRSAPLGPAMRVAVQAALDAQGRIVAWHHRFWSPGHSSRPGRSATPSLFGNALRSGGAPLPEPIDMPLATGGGSERNAVPGYDWPSWQVVGHRVRVPWRASALRSLGAHANVYAAESLLDEVARLTDRCPWAIRLDALGHDARGAAVLRLARQRSDWDARRSALRGVEGAGLGLAYARYKNNGAWCAVVAEVRAEATLRVVRLTVVADVGLPIHPEGVAQQLEGGAVQAVSWTVKESVAADAAGDVALATWDDYPLLGFADMPQVDVHLVASSEPPLGAGETACGPTGAAIGNALFDALGVRVRNLPLTPERIVAAMAS